MVTILEAGPLFCRAAEISRSRAAEDDDEEAAMLINMVVTANVNHLPRRPGTSRAGERLRLKFAIVSWGDCIVILLPSFEIIWSACTRRPGKLGFR